MSDVSISKLLSNDLDNNITYKYTDVNDEDCVQKDISTLNLEKEIQFLKQAWCADDSVENFWFLDDKGTILKLDKFNFIVLEKTGNIHNWNGDEYQEVSVSSRYEVINNNTVKYGVTNVNAVAGNNAGEIKAYFWTIELASSNSILFKFYTFGNNTATLARSYTVQLYKRNLGEELNPSGSEAFMNTYSDIQVSDFIFDAQYSSTSIYDKIIFGVHVDNDFNQWAIVFDLVNDNYYVVQGYGFVGVDGTLTGGEIPVKYFASGKGFNSVVFPLEHLATETKDIADLSELNNIPEEVVGTDVQQWYIDKNINAIVSHVKYIAKTSEWEIVPLYINNNYAYTYESGSFYTRTLSDTKVIAENIPDFMFGKNSTDNTEAKSIITGICAALTWPMLYLLMPKVSMSGYLQQTLGQYAYVHYNSTNNKYHKDLTKENELDNINTEGFNVNEKEQDIDPTKHAVSMIMSDELGFNVQSIKQHVKPDGNKVQWGGVFWVLLLSSAINMATSAMQVNFTQNQTSTNNIGRQYSQMFLQNMSSLGSSDMLVKGISPTVTSIVTGVLTLDMFYSTSDKQKICAGSGYVNHNFVAQCVAQSIVSNQFELNQITIKHCIKEATMYRPKLLLLGLQLGEEALYQSMQAQSNNWNVAGAMSAIEGGNLAGMITAGVIAISVAILDITLAAVQVAVECLDSYCNSIGNTMESSMTAHASRHSYDVEGKHKYGAKTESFMWPCWGCDTPKVYFDEKVKGTSVNNPWSIHQSKFYNSPDRNNIQEFDDQNVAFVTKPTEYNARIMWDSDNIGYYTANCVSEELQSTLPEGMAYVIGTESFLSKVPFKNENIDCGDPVFATPLIQDYIIDRDWQLSQTATAGATVWLSCKDTKLIDGEASNIVLTPWFCGVASPYTAIELRHGIDRQYIRPWAVTPEVLAFNNTGKNAIYKHKLYHAFDGIGYRIVNWVGAPGMNKEFANYHYCFQANDKFKRSNKLPPNQVIGNFNSAPIVAVETDVEDKLYNDVTMPSKGKGLEAGVIGEDKDVIRYSLPIFTEFVNTLPATVKALAPYKLAVVDGITSLCTELRNTQSAYKAPESVDFTIGKAVYRMTPEYICSVTTKNGVVITEDLVPALGLTYLGATPFEAFFYSQATRKYYSYTGGTNLTSVDMLERFRDITMGRYDFINQEVVMQCLATFERLDNNVHDDTDETDNIMCLVLKDRQVAGELTPPITTIFDTNSWFRILSLPCGVVYQGPNRCIVNRSVFSDYMLKGILKNKGNWERVPREEYHPFRKYKKQFVSVSDQIGDEVQVNGWTHNPFLLVTSPMGVASEIDCLYEWEITFAWTKEMEDIYAEHEYVCVNITAETFTPGGKVVCDRPTHVFLNKELFTRTGNFGYYSFRYQSKNGVGNRERLHIWADGYIAISSLQCEYKQVTVKRNEILTIQQDVQDMQEM